jgi:hypothetical protein
MENPQDLKIVIKENKDLNIYQQKERLYVCGRRTFDVKDKLKNLKGWWDANLKCWTFPSKLKGDILAIFDEEKIIPPTDLSSISPVLISYPEAKALPKRVPGSLGFYKKDNTFYVCGSRTYELQDQLSNLGGRYNKEQKCWIIPAKNALLAKELVDKIKTEDAEKKKQKKEQEWEEEEMKTVDEMERQLRLKNKEEEAEFIPHIQRVPVEIRRNS